MIRSKKGFILFVPILVIMSFMLLAYAAVMLHTQKPVVDQSIGESAASMIMKYNDGERFLFYIDKSAEYAANDAVYDLASNGGNIENENCNKINGYLIWSDKCKPDKEKFFSYFNDDFKKYIDAAYPGLGLSYDYEFEEGNAAGLSKKSIGLRIMNRIESKKSNQITGDVSKGFKDASANMIDKYAKEYKIDPVVVKCMAAYGSNFNDIYISKCGTVGLMQLTSGIARKNNIKNVYNHVNLFKCDETYGANLINDASSKSKEELIKIDGRFDAEQNIKAGLKYFSELMHEFDNRKLALAAYYMGADPVKDYNVFVDSDFKQTQDYVMAVEKCIAYENSGGKGQLIFDAGEGAYNEYNKEAKDIGVYEANTSFMAKLDYDFSDYDKIYDLIKMNSECLKDDAEKCFSDELGMKWSAVNSDGMALVDVDTGKKIERFNMNDEGNIIIKFGVDLNNWDAGDIKEVVF